MKFSVVQSLICGSCLSLVGSIRVGDYTHPNQYKVFYTYWNISEIDSVRQGPYFALELKDNQGRVIATQNCGDNKFTWGYGWLGNEWVSPATRITVTKVSSTRVRESHPVWHTQVASGKRQAAGFISTYDVLGFRLELTSVPDNGPLPENGEVELAENKAGFEWPDEEIVNSDKYKVAVRIEGPTADANRVTVVRWGKKSMETIHNNDFPIRIPHEGTLSRGVKLIAYPMSRPETGCEFTVGSNGDELDALDVKKCRLDTNYTLDWNKHYVVFTSVKVQ